MSRQISPVTVLIVDDSDDQRHLLTRYFERAGCEVSAVATAEEAILSELHSTVDLTVIDLLLPGMSGWDLSALMTAERPDCSIAISSVLEPSSYPAEKAALPKPVTAAQVRNLLRATVPRWRDA